VSGFFPPDLTTAHIHLKELYAIFAAVRHFSQDLFSKQLVLFCDNQPAVY
jgi:hypothetical protein